MSKVENSVWRCTWPTPASETGECDATLIQQDMEDHLLRTHRFGASNPLDVVAHFVLVRTAEIARGPGRRKATKDQTEPMFTKGVDFR